MADQDGADDARGVGGESSQSAKDEAPDPLYNSTHRSSTESTSVEKEAGDNDGSCSADGSLYTSAGSRKTPANLDAASSSNRCSTVEMLPGMAFRAIGNAVGLSGLQLSRLASSVAGTPVYDSKTFHKGCEAFLYGNGIFSATIREVPLHGEGYWGVEEVSSSEPTDLDDKEVDYFRSTPLIVSNHVSYLDVLILLHVLRFPKLVAKSEVQNWPVFGALGKELETIWVERSDPDSRKRTIEAIADHAAQWREGDRPLLLWPEGTTSNGKSLLEFRKGAFVPGVPVRPVVVKYTSSWDPSNTNFREGDPPSSGVIGLTTSALSQAVQVPSTVVNYVRSRLPSISSSAPADADAVTAPKATCTAPEGDSTTEAMASENGSYHDEEGLVHYSESDWATQFAGHLVHRCVVLMCRPYYPSQEERDDPALFAEHVRELMVERLEELHAAFEEDSSRSFGIPFLRDWRGKGINSVNSKRREMASERRSEWSLRTLQGWDERLSSPNARHVDNVTVKRKKGISCVVFGDGPVAPAGGDGHRYFEVRVDKVKEGSEDGLALGLTLELPSAWQARLQVGLDVPASWSIGYQGFLCIAGQEEFPHVDWQPNQLEVGDCVGLLVMDTGEVWVVKNGVAVTKMDGVKVPKDRPLFPFVDLLGNTQGVTLNVGATPSAKAVLGAWKVPNSDIDFALNKAGYKT